MSIFIHLPQRNIQNKNRKLCLNLIFKIFSKILILKSLSLEYWSEKLAQHIHTYRYVYFCFLEKSFCDKREFNTCLPQSSIIHGKADNFFLLSIIKTLHAYKIIHILKFFFSYELKQFQSSKPSHFKTISRHKVKPIVLLISMRYFKLHWILSTNGNSHNSAEKLMKTDCILDGDKVTSWNYLHSLTLYLYFTHWRHMHKILYD